MKNAAVMLASLASSTSSVVLIFLIVSQQGILIVFRARRPLALNLIAVAVFPAPNSPKCSVAGSMMVPPVVLT